MKRCAVLSFLILGLMVALAVPAFPDVLCDNTISGTSYETNGLGVVAGSYAVRIRSRSAQDSTVTGAMFGLWVGSGYQATSVTWAITTEPFAGTSLESGTSSVLSSVNVSTSALFATQYNVDIDQVTIAIPNPSLAAGGPYISNWTESIRTIPIPSEFIGMRAMDRLSHTQITSNSAAMDRRTENGVTELPDSGYRRRTSCYPGAAQPSPSGQRAALGWPSMSSGD